MKPEASATIYTLGHSRHSSEDFVAILKRHRIDRVVDVRGQPYSRRNPQFNRERLAGCLKAEGIDYTWNGKHLSGRPEEARFYGPGGEVLWDKLAATPQFQNALNTLADAARSRRLALVCAEEDPMRCHRRFLLTPPLMQRGVEVLHLRGDGRVESESALSRPDGAAAANGQQDLFR